MPDMTEQQAMMLAKKIIEQVNEHMFAIAPNRTITARKLNMQAILEIERKYAVVH